MYELTDSARSRYDRQMMVAGWGDEGQRRLAAATVFVAGVGGLGSPLARAGRLPVFDGLDGGARTLRLRRDPDCPAYGAAGAGSGRPGRPQLPSRRGAKRSVDR